MGNCGHVKDEVRDGSENLSFNRLGEICAAATRESPENSDTKSPVANWSHLGPPKFRGFGNELGSLGD